MGEWTQEVETLIALHLYAKLEIIYKIQLIPLKSSLRPLLRPLRKQNGFHADLL